jgi:7-cyano-7-deazaguanine synthase
MKKCVLIFSGGMDSFTLLHDLIATGYEVHAVSFDYGQRHSKELNYAHDCCETLGVEHRIVDVSSINQLMQGSALTSNIKVPEGHYAEQSMKSTVVPNRNMIMLSLATAYAVSIQAPEVYIGAHAGDHAIYPDCRPEFITMLSAVTEIANYQPVAIHAPYINLSKGQIAEIGKHLELDYSQAWTCYNGREKACGKCGACQERIEAMAEAGITDPMEYEDA